MVVQFGVVLEYSDWCPCEMRDTDTQGNITDAETEMINWPAPITSAIFSWLEGSQSCEHWAAGLSLGSFGSQNTIIRIQHHHFLILPRISRPLLTFYHDRTAGRISFDHIFQRALESLRYKVAELRIFIFFQTALQSGGDSPVSTADVWEVCFLISSGCGQFWSMLIQRAFVMCSHVP